MRVPREPVGFVWPRLLVAVLCLAAFGPYLVGSIRAEQLAVYAMAPLVLFAFMNLRSWTFGLLAAWSAIVFVSLLGVAFPYRGPSPWAGGPLVAGLDNLLLPLMVMLGIWSLVPPAAALPALRTAGRVVVWAAAVNAALAIVSAMWPPLLKSLRPFWSTEASVSTVSELAMQMGRYSGIFNQPAEAGLVYAVASVLAVWVFARRPVAMYLLLTLITVGGMFSVTKVYLLVGLPVTIVLLFLTRRAAGKVGLFIVVWLVAVLLGSASFFQQWSGLDMLTRLFEGPEGSSAVRFYTAGRWNEDSPMLAAVDFILQNSALTGVGTGGLLVAYDSQITETIIVSGVLGIAALVVVFVLLLRWFLRIKEPNLRPVAIAFWCVLVGAAAGLPALTANRAATVVWVVASLLVLVAVHQRSEAKVALAPQNVGDVAG